MACAVVFPKVIKNLQRSTLQLKYQASSLDIKNKYFANFFQIFKETIQLLRVWWVNFLKAFICNTIENLLCRRLVWGSLSWSLGLSINSEIKITYWNIKRKTTYKLKRFINYMINAVSKSLIRFKLHVFMTFSTTNYKKIYWFRTTSLEIIMRDRSNRKCGIWWR